jgi:hypothetical protein
LNNDHSIPVRTGAGDLPFKVAVASWIDLLGYGKMIGTGKLNPAAPEAKEAISRLRAFHRIVAKHSNSKFRTLVLNDGAVAYRDLSPQSSSITYGFLRRTFDLFEEIARLETRNGWPGPRMVLAAGLRAKGSRRAIDRSDRQVELILQRLANGEVSAEQAVREAANVQRYSDLIPQLQANFAFTKAYLAESAGSKRGLGGSRLFVDTTLFCDGRVPAWIDADDPIAFSNTRLSIDCSFVPVSSLGSPGSKRGTASGMRDALQVAEQLAPGAAKHP